jgi:hypothetical protein
MLSKTGSEISLMRKTSKDWGALPQEKKATEIEKWGALSQEKRAALIEKFYCNWAMTSWCGMTRLLGQELAREFYLVCDLLLLLTGR